MTKKLNVAILFGGKSAEHEVSIQSAINIYQAINKNTYDVVAIGIDKQGQWYLNPDKNSLLIDLLSPKNKVDSNKVFFISEGEGCNLYSTISHENKGNVDVVFSVMHGPYGEDGSVQGFLQLLNIPFVGSGVLGSAIGLDKDVTKRLLRDAKLPIGKFFAYTKNQHISFENITKGLGLPLFIKPANLGSSIGITKVKNKKEFEYALRKAFSYDLKVLIEQYIPGIIIECCVLGNENPIVSTPGAIIPTHEFYDYDAKYLDQNGAKLSIPAKLPINKIKEIQHLSLEAFKTLCLEGMARIDFFMTAAEKLYINEVNTIPGFTNISMYPKLWQASGISYTELIDRLIQLAQEKFERAKKLKIDI